MKMSDEECKTFLNKIYDEHGIDGFVKHKGIINRYWFLNNIHPVPERNEYEKENNVIASGIPSPWCCYITGKTEERIRIVKEQVLQQNNKEELFEKLKEMKPIFEAKKQSPFDELTRKRIRKISEKAYSISLVLQLRDKVGMGTISKILGYYGCQKMTDEESKKCLNEIYDEHGPEGLKREGRTNTGKVRGGWFINNIDKVPERNEYEKTNKIRSKEYAPPSAWCCHIIGKTEERTKLIKDHIINQNNKEELFEKLKEMKPIFEAKKFEIEVLTVEQLRKISEKAYSIQLVLQLRDKVKMDEIRVILGFERSWYKYDDDEKCKTYLEDIFEKEGIEGLIPNNLHSWYSNNIQTNKRKPERFQIDNKEQIRGHGGCPSYWCCKLIGKLREREEFIKKTNLTTNTTQELLQKLLNYKKQIYDEMPSQFDWEQLKNLKGRIPELYNIVILLVKREAPMDLVQREVYTDSQTDDSSESDKELIPNSCTRRITITDIRRHLNYPLIGYVTSDGNFKLDSLPEYNFYEVISKKFEIESIVRSEKYGAILNDASKETNAKYLKYEVDFTLTYTNLDGEKDTLIVEIWGNNIDKDGNFRVCKNGRTSGEKYLEKRKIKEEMGQNLSDGRNFLGIEHTTCYKPEEIEKLLHNEMKMKYKNESQIIESTHPFNNYYNTNECDICKEHIKNCIIETPNIKLTDFPPHVRHYINRKYKGLDSLKKTLLQEPKKPKKDLVEECRCRKLKVSGTVDDLIERLENPKENDYIYDGLLIKERPETPGRWYLYHTNKNLNSNNKAGRVTLGVYDSKEEAEKEKQHFRDHGKVSKPRVYDRSYSRNQYGKFVPNSFNC